MKSSKLPFSIAMLGLVADQNKKLSTTDSNNLSDLSDNESEAPRGIVIKTSDGTEVVLGKADPEKKKGIGRIALMTHGLVGHHATALIAALSHKHDIQVLDISAIQAQEKIDNGTPVLIIGDEELQKGSLEHMIEFKRRELQEDILKIAHQLTPYTDYHNQELAFKKEQEKLRRRHESKKKLYRRK